MKLAKLSVLLFAFAFFSCSGDDQTEEEVIMNEAPKAEEAQGNQRNDSLVANMLPQTRAVNLTAEQRKFVQKNNDFSFNFYRALIAAQPKKESVISSPLSLTYVLGMLNAGAQGKTSEEILSLLGYNANNTQEINEFCKSLIEQAGQVDPSVTMKMANCFVVNQWFSPYDSYVKDMDTYYHAEVSSRNFTDPATLDYINGWCNRQTEGMIPKILEKLDPATVFVLMNAVYFKATWAEQFDVADTRDEIFVSEDGNRIMVPMMYRKAMTMCYGNNLYRALRFFYGGKDTYEKAGYEMVVLLPQDGKTVEDVINGLTQEKWNYTLEHQRQQVIAEIKIPRFSTESDMVLNDVIANMGAPSMFKPNEADFSKMMPLTKSGKSGNNLFVSLLKQKAAVEVLEEGTKMSAVTIAKMDLSCGPITAPQIDFHCNRPFVYFVQEASTGAIFFIGTYRGENK